jgi:DNA-binding NarL/FixJ family response regulator
MSKYPSIADHQAEEIPVVVADDHGICRAGIRTMLEGSEFHIVGEAASGKEALAVVRQCGPQLVVMDIRFAGKSGLDTLEALKSEFPSLVVVVLTIYDDHTYIARALASGAAAYLFKGTERDALLSALRTVMRGETLLSAESLLRSLHTLSKNVAKSHHLFQPLTDREKEVVCLLATGLSNRDIGRVLCVAESTVKTHVEHIIGKLGVSDRLQAAVWAAWQGLVPNPD